LDQGAEKYQLTEAELKKLGETVDLERVLKLLKEEKVVPETATWSDISFSRPKVTEGSDGFHSRLSINEVLAVSPAIKDLVMQGATDAKIEEQAKKEGMSTMLEDGVFKAAQGLTTIEEVLRVVSE
jgi:type IV pilus assembly protein PilB